MDSYESIRRKKHKLQMWRFCWCLIGVLGLLGLVAGIIYLNQFELALQLNGPDEITLEYGDQYVELGATATFSGKYLLKSGTALNVSMSNTIDQDVIGEYDVSYSSGYGPLKKCANRVVRVVDTVSPEINLVGDTEIFVQPGMVYVEQGFSAYDNYDGDLTSRVNCTTGEDYILYRVKDKSGNCTEVKRLVHYSDPIPPDLFLIDGDSVSVTVGTQFVDPGFTATDNCDGDLTETVETSGTVDVNRPGSYVLSYSVQDSFGNVATAYRTVTVVGANEVETVVPEGKVIYLTFDDGPSAYTEKLLDVLERNEVKATFFVVNTDYSYLISKIVEKGHSVGIHSATHNYRKIYASENAFVSDLQKMQNVIYEKSGVNTFLMRFPGGSSNTVSRYNPGIMTRLSAVVGDMGFQYFDWNVDSGDASTASTASQVAQNVISAVENKDISIVLQHDSKGFSVDAVEEIIKWGKENGYSFMALSPDSPCVHHGINN